MKRLSLLFLVLLSAVIAFGQIYEPVKWSFKLDVTGKNTANVVLTATVDKGWHVYGMDIPENGPKPTTIRFDEINNAQKVGGLTALSKVHKLHDPNFDMDLTWYEKEAVFVQKIKFADASKVSVKGVVEFMSCNDETCTPPAKVPFSLGVSAVSASSAGSASAPATTPVVPAQKQLSADTVAKVVATAPLQTVTPAIDSTEYWKPVIDQLRSFGDVGKQNGAHSSLWLIFLAGMLGGFLALFTPCVWPIIPMTVSFFLKRSQNKSRGRRDAILYGLSIIFIYVTLGILITLIFGASALNSLSTNAVFNLIFFALLVLFAISFFGAFEITLPASWSTKLDAKADSTAGILSILFMAFTLVLVSFSCTGPIIGTLLVEVSTSGSVLAPAVGMFGFAVALSVPFSLFALFPSWLKSLPKSGGWLNAVKVVLAFLELALALKFLSVADLAYGWRILDREVFLALWIVIFILLGIYLLGKIRFPHDSETKHTSVLGVFLAIISFAFAVYMIPGLWGAPLKAVSAFSPPLTTQDFNLYKDEVHPAFTDYDQGMAFAAEKKLPVIVDFTGFGCVNCRKMEASVWTDVRVKELLTKNYVLISLFVDDKTPLAKPYQVQENGRTMLIETIGDKWSYLQRFKFGANAQPFYVMLDNKGMPLNRAYVFDDKPEHFINWLEKK